MNTKCRLKPSLVLGIDTGGTYTDGVLMDYSTHRVLASCKSLTTKRDLSIGIDAVLQGMDIEDPSAIQMVSVSTTLATNAVAEGKSKRVALLLIGYDPDLIDSFQLQRRFGAHRYFYFTGGHDLYGREKAPLDLPAILEKTAEIKNEIDALAVSSYFSPLNPDHERRAFEALSSTCDLPVVLGHQLSTRLGSIERATTASLNASLLAVLKEFIIAVRRAMEHRGINAPLLVVRGDGTLMSDEFAVKTPVETIHSGPAASAIGGRFLSHLDQALVVDIGGTTTDIALVENGQVAVSEEGATVAGYKTAVKAADLFSIALGGDSHITLSAEKRIMIGPARVAPLAYLSDHFPTVRNDLAAHSRRSDNRLDTDRLEYWYLLRSSIDPNWLQTKEERELVEFLGYGPRPLPEIISHLHLYSKVQIPAENLLRLEIIGKSGLTPTDLLHEEGRYNRWDDQAASLGMNIFCRSLHIEPDDFRELIWSRMTEDIVYAIVAFLSGRRFSTSHRAEKDDFGRWFFHNSLYDHHPHLETRFRLRPPIIGIGAPAAVFLKKAAEKLHCDLILPKHHEVANAVGAVAGSVVATETILVYPLLTSDGIEIIGFTVQTNENRLVFDDAEEALEQARNLVRERALGAALRSGADNPEVTVEEINDGLDAYRIRARAVGTPRLMQKESRQIIGRK